MARSAAVLSIEHTLTEDCHCLHGRFHRYQCLYWQKAWGDVPKALTEARVVTKTKTKAAIVK